MAIPLTGALKTATRWGLIVKIEIRQQGTGSFLSVGRFDNASLEINAMSEEGDPAGTMYTYAHEYVVGWEMIQTEKAAEITAMMTGTAATGLVDTDVEVKLTFVDARTITLGAVTNYPLRIVANYTRGDDQSAQRISCSGQIIEPVTALTSKIS